MNAKGGHWRKERNQWGAMEKGPIRTKFIDRYV